MNLDKILKSYDITKAVYKRVAPTPYYIGLLKDKVDNYDRLNNQIMDYMQKKLKLGVYK